MKRVRLHKTVFNRWIIVDAKDESLAWSGSQWVEWWSESPLGLGIAQVSNLGSLDEAKEYARRFGFEVVEIRFPTIREWDEKS